MANKYIKNINDDDWLIINKFRKDQRWTWEDLFHFLAVMIEEKDYVIHEFKDAFATTTFRDSKTTATVTSGEVVTTIEPYTYEPAKTGRRDKGLICPHCGWPIVSQDITCPKCKKFTRKF